MSDHWPDWYFAKMIISCGDPDVEKPQGDRKQFPVLFENVFSRSHDISQCFLRVWIKILKHMKAFLLAWIYVDLCIKWSVDRIPVFLFKKERILRWTIKPIMIMTITKMEKDIFNPNPNSILFFMGENTIFLNGHSMLPEVLVSTISYSL